MLLGSAPQWTILVVLHVVVHWLRIVYRYTIHYYWQASKGNQNVLIKSYSFPHDGCPFRCSHLAEPWIHYFTRRNCFEYSCSCCVQRGSNIFHLKNLASTLTAIHNHECNSVLLLAFKSLMFCIFGKCSFTHSGSKLHENIYTTVMFAHYGARVNIQLAYLAWKLEGCTMLGALERKVSKCISQNVELFL